MLKQQMFVNCVLHGDPMVLLDTDPVDRTVGHVLEVHQHYACAGGCKIEVVLTTAFEEELIRAFGLQRSERRAS